MSTAEKRPEVATAQAANGEAAPLLAKIAAAMAETSRVTKDKRNTDQGYSYASVEAMLEEVRGPLHQRGVLLLPAVTAVAEEEIRSKSGTAGTKVVLTVDFTFLDGRSGDQHAITGWRGEGQDYGDKAYGKAYTNAIKTFVRSAWLLPAGDDPEQDSPEREARNGAPAWAAAAKTPAKKAMLDALEPVIGDRKIAGAYAKTLADTIGEMPALVAAWIGALPAWQEKARAQSGEAVQPPQEGADDAQAQAASGEPEVEEVDGEPVDGPDDEERFGIAPASVDPPVLPADDEEGAYNAMREAGCTCEHPLGADEGRDDHCPIKGHGLAF